ncbi:MAG TPA: OmpA family protein [Polyangiaceae bacterium LLY-WYZ-15_(1-7)]|nr:OmpA family protein [Polyangiaceae bacterium LLY-WYZ-15_(1-7)]HJL04546.1 OmpA family protein [Polyangiaceae bacterium LLY-WYZ-15_(1-7)]HJL07328.1 OmpA family protein [Polyangiaceae bacterium LLY-WYZ-15_(1-7)]HJL27215.1 OmpA family protein [Polyangiaceae bacterium LLY-WYZ-15_(1-7)]HJL27931.1 OmpA family protein [Polyangiaceae bacterium LLY-WYZ-15_(1-7)]
MGRVALWTVVVATASVLSAPASAQETSLERFSVNRFGPAPGSGNYLQVDGANVRGHLVPGAGLTIDYAHEPFVLFDASCTDETETNCDVDGKNTELVSYMLQFNLFGSIALWERVQIGLNLPLLLTSGEGFNDIIRGTPTSIPGGTSFVVGDPTLSVKARLYGGGEGLGLAAAVYGTFPVANQMDDEGFGGDESLRVGGHLIGEFIHSGFHVSANVGGYYRPERQLFSTRAGSQITYRLALGYEVTPLVMVFGEVDGAAGLTSEVDEHPLEGRLGARLRQGDLTFTLAGGAGIVSGVGVPVFRVIGGMAYAPQRGDRDGDGIEDAVDACPTEEEDLDEWEDEDGCPEADNDGDGMLDGDDPCPNRAEDMDGFEDEDGCPDEDNDGDGIRDGFDSCPSDPEDMDGDRDEDGCPDNDTDRDGIEDADDRCPNEPEDADGFGDEDGCPEDDFDGDTISDEMDECPDEPEIMNGIADEDGCPEPDGDGDGIPDEVDRCPGEAETLNGTDDDDGCPDGAALVELRDDRIVLIREVHFRPNRPRIRMSRSRPVLDAVATLLGRNPQFQRVLIEGHVTDQDDDERNRRLSQARADAVKEALVERGIDAGRLTAQGFGSERPPSGEGDAHDRIDIVIQPNTLGRDPMRSNPDATAEAAEGEAEGEAAEE